MNAPKEYYPVGYEKNFDDNFATKVDLPPTSFHCGDQKHFPGLYGDTDLGCMVWNRITNTSTKIEINSLFFSPSSCRCSMFAPLPTMVSSWSHSYAPKAHSSIKRYWNAIGGSTWTVRRANHSTTQTCQCRRVTSWWRRWHSSRISKKTARPTTNNLTLKRWRIPCYQQMRSVINPWLHRLLQIRQCQLSPNDERQI